MKSTDPILHICNVLYAVVLIQLIRDLGPLEWVFNTPKHHRVHHGEINFVSSRSGTTYYSFLIFSCVWWHSTPKESAIKRAIKAWMVIFVLSVVYSQNLSPTGRNEYCIDKNYGGILIIWDRIFGKKKPSDIHRWVWINESDEFTRIFCAIYNIFCMFQDRHQVRTIKAEECSKQYQCFLD